MEGSWLFQIQIEVHEDHLDVGLQVVVKQPVCLLCLLDPLLEAPDHQHNHNHQSSPILKHLHLLQTDQAVMSSVQAELRSPDTAPRKSPDFTLSCQVDEIVSICNIFCLFVSRQIEP